MIRGKVAEYAPGAIGDVSQRLVEQFAGNVEQLLATQASTGQASTGRASTGQGGATRAGRRTPFASPARWMPPRPNKRPDKRAVAAAALLLAGGALAASALAALAVWRRRHPELSPSPDTPWYISHEGARHG
jgi:hypothetical protein